MRRRILPRYRVVRGPELSEAVHQAIGAASTCWESLHGAGEFQSRRAEQIGGELLGIIRQYARRYTRPARWPARRRKVATLEADPVAAFITRAMRADFLLRTLTKDEVAVLPERAVLAMYALQRAVKGFEDGTSDDPEDLEAIMRVIREPQQASR